MFLTFIILILFVCMALIPGDDFGHVIAVVVNLAIFQQYNHRITLQDTMLHSNYLIVSGLCMVCLCSAKTHVCNMNTFQFRHFSNHIFILLTIHCNVLKINCQTKQTPKNQNPSNRLSQRKPVMLL